MRKQIGRRLDQVAARRQIERGREAPVRRRAALRRVRPLRRRGAAAPWARNARTACRARAALRRRRLARPPARGRARVRSASRGRPPGRSKVGSPRQATMVDSTPTGQGPASITMSMRPRRSASTCAALVGETWPERLAEGATTGPLKAASKARATGCAGTRTATLSRPASARSATPQSGRFGSTSVSGPGQNAAAKRFGGGIEAPEPPRGFDARRHGRSAD